MLYQKIISIINTTINHISDANTKKEISSLIPKKSFLTSLLSKDFSEKKYKEIYNKLSTILLKYYLTIYPFVNILNNTVNYNLSIALSTYYDHFHSLEKTSIGFKIYPIALTETEQKKQYEIDLKMLIHTHLETGISIERLIIQRTKEYENLTTTLLDNLQNSNIEPYYGLPSFMFERAMYITKQASFINHNYDLSTPLAVMQNFIKKYPLPKPEQPYINYTCYNYYSQEFKEDYKLIEEAYLSILAIENKITPIVIEKWHQFLTNPNNHNSNHFAYIAHTFTEGLVPPAKISKACCTLATNQLLPMPYGNCGILFELSSDNLETMCTTDAGSWITNKQEFIINHLPKKVQLTDPNNNCIFYENSQLSKLFLPENFEREVIAKNIAYNGEILNYHKALGYPEILLKGNLKVTGVFYTDNCLDITTIAEYAQQYNLPLIPLSLKEQRLLNNLPLNEESLTNPTLR